MRHSKRELSWTPQKVNYHEKENDKETLDEARLRDLTTKYNVMN